MDSDLEKACGHLRLHPASEVDWMWVSVLLSGAGLSPEAERGLDALVSLKMTLFLKYDLFYDDVPEHLRSRLEHFIEVDDRHYTLEELLEGIARALEDEGEESQ